MIDHLGLYHTVFTDSTKPRAPRPSLEGWTEVYEYFHSLASESRSTPGSLYEVLVTSDEARYYAWVLACIVPFAQLPTPSGGKPKKQLPPATLAAKEGIKAPNKLADVITGAVRHLDQIRELKAKIDDRDPCMDERDRFGMAVRGWEASGAHWRLQVLFAMLHEMITHVKTADGKDTTAGKSCSALHTFDMRDLAKTTSVIQEIQISWKEFLNHLEKLDVMEAPSMKPLIDGRTLLEALSIKKPGKWMSPALDICMAWQLRNPGETNPAGAFEEVRKQKDELGIATHSQAVMDRMVFAM